jgi:hypothetical protein
MENLKNAYGNVIVIPENKRSFRILDREILDELRNCWRLRSTLLHGVNFLTPYCDEIIDFNSMKHEGHQSNILTCIPIAK